ncbi:MAG: short-subunit dehydrogenase [Cyclobacteriaceae bacterium]|jgi:short-subunit dehydrogenase
MSKIFITGGARGIGLATAKIFIEQGWEVGIFDWDREAIDKAAESLPNTFVRLYTGDVLSKTDLHDALSSFASEGLDCLLNNVGIIEVGEFDEIDIERQLQIVDINLKGYMLTTSVALPFLKMTSQSVIVNMASAAALYGNPEITAYAASKAAVKSLTEAWNIAFRKYSIRCCDILPIYVRTRMVDDYVQDYRKLRLQDVKLTPDQVSEVIWKAMHGRKIHYYVGFETKIYARLINWVPDGWLPLILRKVLGYND